MPSSVISVIVPIYNVENYLDRCIESIVNQTYKDLEIILVDDGSPDNCPQICDSWAEKDNRIKVVHKENGGLSDARNAGMLHVTGEIVSFIDSDDWIESNMFEKMLTQMEQDNSDIVSCGVKWVEENGKLLRNDTVEQNEILDTHSAMSELINDGKLKQHVWNKIYKTELIKAIPFEKGKYHEDVFWSYQIIGRAECVSVVPDSYYYYVQRTNSIMGEGFSEKRLDALDANYLRCEYMKKNFPDLFDNALYVYIGSCHYQLQCAVRTNQPDSVIQNILDRLDYRKSGHPTRGITAKQKLWYYLFTCFPLMTSKLRNALNIGV